MNKYCMETIHSNAVVVADAVPYRTFSLLTVRKVCVAMAFTVPVSAAWFAVAVTWFALTVAVRALTDAVRALTA